MNRFFLFFVCVLYGKFKCYDTKIIYGNMLLYEIKKNIFINAKNANENTTMAFHLTIFIFR